MGQRNLKQEQMVKHLAKGKRLPMREHPGGRSPVLQGRTLQAGPVGKGKGGEHIFSKSCSMISVHTVDPRINPVNGIAL